MNKREGRERQKEGKGEKGKWVKDLSSEGWKMLEHFIFKDPNIYTYVF